MNHERFQQRILSYAQAITRLKEALAQPKNSFIRDAVIQRFEFTYETAWKATKLWLEGKDIDVRNPKDTLTAALEQGLIVDGNAWSALHRMRNLTLHTYDEAIAEEVFGFVSTHAVALFEALEQKLR